ncbi:hypothetical protein BV898_03093 [Hypsibius exemplaris]|uniref:Uncharacterized protein n=1 Tax=Hypsibius exemplaris TaxID=2072580 RepID=A0A1W0X6C9_HYPEX|nr:hypothetical protein BV898_03093 [Hypsibius exemplaris]
MYNWTCFDDRSLHLTGIIPKASNDLDVSKNVFAAIRVITDSILWPYPGGAVRLTGEADDLLRFVVWVMEHKRVYSDFTALPHPLPKVTRRYRDEGPSEVPRARWANQSFPKGQAGAKKPEG